MRILRRICGLSTAELEELQGEVLLEIQRRKEALTIGPAAPIARQGAEKDASPKAKPPRRRAA
jgi:hypothetical protein